MYRTAVAQEAGCSVIAAFEGSVTGSFRLCVRVSLNVACELVKR